MTSKKKCLNYFSNPEAIQKLCEANIDEQLTILFEIENGVDFSKQTPDEIAKIMLGKLGFSNE